MELAFPGLHVDLRGSGNSFCTQKREASPSPASTLTSSRPKETTTLDTEPRSQWSFSSICLLVACGLEIAFWIALVALVLSLWQPINFSVKQLASSKTQTTTGLPPKDCKR